MNIFRQILAFLAALAIANPLCCCFGMECSSDGEPKSRHCCSSQPSDTSNKEGSDSPDPVKPCPCKNHIKTVELELTQPLTLDSYLTGILPIDINEWNPTWPKSTQLVHNIPLGIPPPPQDLNILFSVFTI